MCVLCISGASRKQCLQRCTSLSLRLHVCAHVCARVHADMRVRVCAKYIRCCWKVEAAEMRIGVFMWMHVCVRVCACVCACACGCACVFQVRVCGGCVTCACVRVFGATGVRVYFGFCWVCTYLSDGARKQELHKCTGGWVCTGVWGVMLDGGFESCMFFLSRF